MHRFPEAEQHLKKALAVDPKSIQASIDLANFYRLQNRLPESQQVLQDGVKNNPDGILLYIGGHPCSPARVGRRKRRLSFSSFKNNFPNSADAAMAIGDFYLAYNRSEEALSEYRRALSDAPKNLDIKKRILDLYLLTKQTELAAVLDRELMKDAPKDVLVRVGHGRVLMAQGKSAEAIDQLQRVVSDDVDSPQAHYFLAMAYEQKREDGAKRRASCKQLSRIQQANRCYPMVLEALTRLQPDAGGSYQCPNLRCESWFKNLPQTQPIVSSSRRPWRNSGDLAKRKHKSSLPVGWLPTIRSFTST